MKKYDLALGAAMAWGVFGCGDGGETAGGTGGSATTSTTSSTTSTTTTVTTTTTSTGTGGGGPLDESTSCDDAPEMEAKQNDAGGTFYDYTAVHGEPGDIDYFKIDAKKGQWIRVGTDVDPDQSEANTVVTLLSADGKTQLAQNNNVIGGSNTVESELFYLSLEEASYCVKIEDYSTFAGQDPLGGPGFVYRATMVPIDFTLYSYYSQDTEPNDSTSAPQVLGVSVDDQSKQISAGIAGTYSPTDTLDVYEVTAPEKALGMNVLFTPPGTNGYGSTQNPGYVNLYEADGSTILAQLDVQKGARGLSSVPVVPGNKYFLEVGWPQGEAAGKNDFYYLKLYSSSSQNPQEQDEAGNGDAAKAEAGTPTPDGKTIHFYVGGLLPVPDTDWWSFDAAKDDEIALACSSWRAGSGVRDATVAIYSDPVGSPLQSETEVEDKSVVWSTASTASKKPLKAAASGKHYLQIGATKQAADVTSSFYLCGIHVTSP